MQVRLQVINFISSQFGSFLRTFRDPTSGQTVQSRTQWFEIASDGVPAMSGIGPSVSQVGGGEASVPPTEVARQLATMVEEGRQQIADLVSVAKTVISEVQSKVSSTGTVIPMGTQFTRTQTAPTKTMTGAGSSESGGVRET